LKNATRVRKANRAIAHAIYQNQEHWAMHGTAINPDTEAIAGYNELSRCSDGALWHESNTEEIGRMFQGLGPTSNMPTGTNTLYFISPTELPKDSKPTYIRVVCADRPEKPQTRRVRWTAGGDRVVYHGNTTTKTADITTANLMFNSVISTPNAKFMTIDLKDFYLCSELDVPAYVRIPLTLLPQKIIDLYQLQDKIVNGHVYAKVCKGMYGLPQAGRLAYEQLRKFLEPHGYVPCTVTPGLWKDLNSDLMFTLVVDDFGVRYTNRKDVEKLINTLKLEYKCSSEWEGDRYIGLTLKWDYQNRTVIKSMPGYIQRALLRFEHPLPHRREDSPHEWSAPVYGARQQYAKTDDSAEADAADKLRIQEVLGTLLYYGRAIDCTLLAAIGSIACQQAQPTRRTVDAIVRLLNYVASNPNGSVKYIASDMILWVESDASYLSESKARSRFAGFHYLSSQPHPDRPPQPDDPPPPLNGAINVPSKILREIVSSAGEAELAGLFYNGKEAVPERTTLEELGHPQPPTPMITDNQVACGIANDSVKQKRSKAMDMRFYWIRDRINRKQFHVFWKRGNTNLADYPSKHHPVSKHRAMRPLYLHEETDPTKPSRTENYYSVLAGDAKDTPNLLPAAAAAHTFTCEGVLNPSQESARAARGFHVALDTGSACDRYFPGFKRILSYLV
jgi:hypothetical protein